MILPTNPTPADDATVLTTYRRLPIFSLTPAIQHKDNRSFSQILNRLPTASSETQLPDAASDDASRLEIRWIIH